LLTKKGEVYTCGSNADGRLGIGNTGDSDIAVPTLARVQGVTMIAAGGRQSVFLQGCGNVWVTGSNQFGLIGLGEDVGMVSTPTKLTGLKHVAAITASPYLTMFLLCDGSVYGTGYNQYFQLAVGHNDVVYTPTKSFYEDVVAISVGYYAGTFLTSDGQFHIAGNYDYYGVAFPNGATVSGFGMDKGGFFGGSKLFEEPAHRPSIAGTGAPVLQLASAFAVGALACVAALAVVRRAAGGGLKGAWRSSRAAAGVAEEEAGSSSRPLVASEEQGLCGNTEA